MIFFKTLRCYANIFHPLQRRTSSSNNPPTNPSPKTLSSLFANLPSKTTQITKPSTNQKLRSKDKIKVMPKFKYRTIEEKEFPREISAEGAMLVSRLTGDGYLNDANFSKGRDLEPQKIPANFYSRHFLKMAAEKFGRDHQEVAKIWHNRKEKTVEAEQNRATRGRFVQEKTYGRATWAFGSLKTRWLSGSDLKKIALFGCPSTERKSVFAAKRLRAFFHIQEDVICRGCKLKNSCRFAYERVGTMDKVVLEDVMRLVTVYTLDLVPSQLVIPDELKCSIAKLVAEAVSLTN